MANTTNRVAGTANLTIDGVTNLVRGDVVYFCGLVTRETVTGVDTVHGYKEVPTAPYIEFSLTNAGGLDVGALNSLTNSTVQIQLANGKTIIGRNMWTTEPQEVAADEGKVKARFEGQQGAVTEN